MRGQTDSMPALIAWWTQDVHALAPDADPQRVTDTGARLLGQWTAPGRAYHGTTHLVEMFWALEELTEAGELDEEQARVARIAAWFHDAVYNPRAAAGANEAASAQQARDDLTALGVDSAVTDEVARLVDLTAEHRAQSDDHLGQALCDADLWILSAPASRYAEYTQQVRHEYGHVPAQAFRTGRRRVLEHLAAGGLYATGHARAHWEGRGQQNVQHELRLMG